MKKKKVHHRKGHVLAGVLSALTMFSSLESSGEVDAWGNEIRNYTEGGKTYTYQFVKSGVPVLNPYSSSQSSGSALVTGTLSTSTVASSLEARYRTRMASPATSVDSSKSGMCIIIY